MEEVGRIHLQRVGRVSRMVVIGQKRGRCTPGR